MTLNLLPPDFFDRPMRGPDIDLKPARFGPFFWTLAFVVSIYMGALFALLTQPIPPEPTLKNHSVHYKKTLDANGNALHGPR